MSSRRRVSSVASSRIHNSYIDRVKGVRGATTVEGVGEIDSIKNQTSYASANYLIASDYFYENLKELKKEYKGFYHHHGKLEKAIKNLEENDGELVEHMQELIEKYNIAMVSLKDLDKVLKTNYISEIKNIIDVFKKPLKTIGIDVDAEYKMFMEKEIFIKEIEISRDPIRFLFEPIHGMVIKLYKAFKNIKYPSKTGIIKEYTDIVAEDVSGLLLDKKS